MRLRYQYIKQLKKLKKGQIWSQLNLSAQ